VRYFEIFGPSTPTDPESVRPPYWDYPGQ
jgi:hypothetical protein